eukprot:scaffold1199_cov265-Pinguiococcus_pyrenoidosus.AAC.33
MRRSEPQVDPPSALMRSIGCRIPGGNAAFSTPSAPRSSSMYEETLLASRSAGAPGFVWRCDSSRHRALWMWTRSMRAHSLA